MYIVVYIFNLYYLCQLYAAQFINFSLFSLYSNSLLWRIVVTCKSIVLAF